MALDETDCYFILSNGMYAGDDGETTGVTDTQRFLRILSLGLIDSAPAPVSPTGNIFSFVRRGFKRIFHQWEA